jgi:hypothetical protein
MGTLVDSLHNQALAQLFHDGYFEMGYTNGSSGTGDSNVFTHHEALPEQMASRLHEHQTQILKIIEAAPLP